MVFIDESGDPGFKIAKGSSPTFVVSMVIFDSFEEAEKASAAIQESRGTLRIKPEFKFNKCHPNAKDGFFETVSPYLFKVRSLVVKKEHVYSGYLRENKDSFYNFFIRLLMAHDNESLNNARVKIDGSGDRQFKRELNNYLRRELGKGKISGVKFVDSRKDNLIQLADMSAGAVARAFSANRKDANRWLRMLQKSGKIGDIWVFK